MSAVVLPVGTVLAVSAPSAWAAAPVNGTGTVSCTSATGQLKFNPPLTATGPTAGSETVSVKMILAGCTASGSNAGGTFGGKAVGTVSTNTGSNCSGLASSTPLSTTAAVPVKWKGASIKLNSSTLGLTQIKSETTGSLNGNPGFAFGGSSGAAAGSLSGSFQDNNVSGEIDLASNTSTILGLCTGKHGVKKLLIGAAVING